MEDLHCVLNHFLGRAWEKLEMIGTIRVNDQKYLNCQYLLMENTVNARFECTYTLSCVLSLGHNCVLMIISNSALLLFGLWCA